MSGVASVVVCVVTAPEAHALVTVVVMVGMLVVFLFGFVFEFDFNSPLIKKKRYQSTNPRTLAG